jgi:hypothetical protein
MSLTLREEHKRVLEMRVFEKSALGRIFRPKR